LTTKAPVLRIALIAALAVLVLVPAAFAARGGKGGNTTGGSGSGSSLSLAMVTDVNGDGHPNYGDTVTFNVSASVSYPMVNLTCYQTGNPNAVDNQTVGFYAGWPWSRDFPLSSWIWPGGAANCTATLYYQTTKGNQTLATLSVPVNA